VGVAREFGVGTASAGKKGRKRRVSESLARVSLQIHFPSRYPAGLSGGQRQRVCLARALLWGPRLLIAGEPVAGLDLSVKAQVLISSWLFKKKKCGGVP